jgi:ERCC4-type nuclease
LKRGKPQPSAEEALAIMKEATGTHETSRFNPVSHGFLSKLPGIDSKNVYSVLNRCDSLDLLCSMTEIELGSIIENSQTGCVLYSGLHSKLTTGENSDVTEGSSSRKPAFKAKTGPGGSRGRRK